MTLDTERLARIEAVLGLEPPPPVVTPSSVMPLPPNVAAGELIESAWGNAVVQGINDAATSGKAYAQPAWHGKTMTVGGFATVSTDVNGIASIPFGLAFATDPIVLVNTGDILTASHIVAPTGVFTTSITILARWAGTGGPVINSAISVWWVAIGQRP